MSNDADTSDDLIAELAKLMAQDAQSERPAPASETPKDTKTSAPPVETPRPAAAGPTVAVRIPGMSEPARGNQQPAAASPVKLDFGKPPVAPALVTPEPLTWQDQAAKPAAGERKEPTLGAAASSGQHYLDGRLPDKSDDGIDFDFGFGDHNPQRREPDPSQAVQAQAAQPRKLEPLARIEPVSTFDPVPRLDIPAKAPVQQAPVAKVADKPAPAVEEHDVIAELIAAELAAEQPRSTAAMPAPKVEPEATRNNVTLLTAKPATAQGGKPASAPILRAVNLTPKQPQESDKFVTAPVFGLPGAKPAEAPPVKAFGKPADMAPDKPQPSFDDVDPIDEIESLIGDAVRIELGTRDQQPKLQEPVAPKSAVVMPLNTPFARRKTTPVIPEPSSTDSAEDAILAAAAATGAEVGRIETEFEEPKAKRRAKKAEREPREARPAGSFRQYVGPAVAGTLLLLAGFGLYWVLGMGRGETVAPVLTADANPVKEAPATPTVDANATQGSVVFDELDGVTAAAGAETLVSRDQSGDQDVTGAVTPGGNTETLLANRKVRTVTVRPDGTIVSGDDAVAGTAELPVDRPNVPDLPGTDTALAASDLLAGAAADAAAAGLPDAASALTNGTDAAVLPSETAGMTPIDPSTPYPMPRPDWRASVGSDTPVMQTTAALATDTPAPAAPVIEVASIDPVVETDAGPAEIVGDITAETPVTAVVEETPALALIEEPAAGVAPVTEVAAVTPAEETPAATATPTNAAAWVQLSSQRSEADAEATRQQLQGKFGILFDGVPLEIQRTDLGAKGIYYRVRLPATSLATANQICADVVEAGGECFTM